jgi:hypothetical protein
LQNFATKNNFTYEATNTVQAVETELALPYDGIAYPPRHKMSGNLNGLHFEYLDVVMQMKNYNGVTTGSTQPTRGANIFRVTLPVRMPGLFADSKFNNIKGFNIKVNSFPNMQKYVLEGNFSETYTVLAEKNTQIDVLSIFSPDVMDALMHNFHYDLWIHDQELMLIVHPATEIEYFAAIPLVFKNVEVLLKEIDKIARALRQTDAQNITTPDTANIV